MKKLRNDFILIGAFLLIAVLVAIIFFTCSKKDDLEVIVYHKEELIYQGNLKDDYELEIQSVQIVIENQSVFVKQSNCKDQICVLQHPIHYAGQSIICLPNQVSIQLKGKVVDVGI